MHRRAQVPPKPTTLQGARGSTKSKSKGCSITFGAAGAAKQTQPNL